MITKESSGDCEIHGYDRHLNTGSSIFNSAFSVSHEKAADAMSVFYRKVYFQDLGKNLAFLTPI